MEEILEFIIEVYMGIMTHFVPDKKVKKVYIKLIAGIWAAILMISGLIAIALLGETDGESVAGKVILAVCLILTVCQIIAGIIIVKRKSK